MLMKSNNSIGGDGIVTATSFSIGGGFGDVFGGVSPPAAVTSAGNNNNVDGLLVTGTSSTIGDSIITFSPVKDAELRRRARNNAILAKIQELEANATVQAARSERLRMMREEYEALVRKYASNGKWNWGQGSSSNGFLNENNGHRQATYLGRYNSQQQPFIFAPGPAQQLLASTMTVSSAPENVPFHASSFQRGMEYNNANNINRSFTTTVGVNTDITGPVRQADVLSPATLEKDNDLPRWSGNLERKRVTVVVDTCSQTEVPPASAVLLSSGPLISDDGKGANQTSIVMAGIEAEKREVSFVGKANNTTIANKKLPMNMEMMMMMEDEDDESLLEAHQRTKLQREHFHRQLKQPKGVQVQVQATSHYQDQPVDETPSNNSSPSAVSSPLGEVPSTSNTTEEVFKLRQRQQKQQQQQEQESEKKAPESGGTTSKKIFQGNMMETTGVDRLNEISSVETTTASLANKDPGDKLSKSIMLRHEMADLSLSDSNSVFQIQKHKLQRKKLMEELAATTASRNRKNNAGHEDDIGDRAEDTTINDSADDDDDDDETKDKSGPRSELASQGVEQSGKKKEVANEEETIQQCSSPTTAGATSESIGDSMMDSIQKTPDTLPRDDSELHGIAEEANEEEAEEIELDHNVSLAGGNNADAESVRERGEDDVLEALVGASNGKGSKSISLTLSGGGGANERPSNGGRISLKTETREEIKELVAHRHHEEEEDEINDAEEIRSNNLSSSKLGVLVEEENFPHANNPGETNSGSMTGFRPAKSRIFPTVPSAFQHDAFFEGEREQKKVASGVYEDMGGQRKESMFQVKEKDEEQVHEKEISQSDSDAINELKRKNKIYSYAPSANMPASNVFSALNVTDGANDESRLSKGQSTILPPASSSPPGHLSTGSSSSSSSRQHSFDELGVGDDAGSNKSIPKTMERRGSGSEQDWSKTKDEQEQQQNCLPTSPQAVNKRHPLLQQQQIKKGGNKKTSATLQGTDMMPERLNSYPKSATNMVTDNGGAKEKGATLEKTTKASSVPATSSPLFSPAKKGSGGVAGGSESSSANMMAENPLGAAVNLNGSGNNEGVTNIPANNVRAGKNSSGPSPGKPVHGGGGGGPGGATTTPSGITGANNTAKRFRLKFNYDDSESDSSEIGPAKSNSKAGPAIIGSLTGSQQMNVTAGQKSTSRSQPQTGSITGGKVEANESEKVVPSKKHEEKDDDFDDFFDI